MTTAAMSVQYDVDLDLRGLNCPLPILRTKKQLVTMLNGQVVRVRATDPHSVIDFTAFCIKTGHELVDHWRQEDEFYFLVRKCTAN